MVKLYGGAITADIPSVLVDASKFRPVPDTQEVFVGRVNNEDVSLLIDLLEPIKADTLIESLANHVDEVHRLSNPERVETVSVSTQQINDHHVATRDDVVVSKEGKTLILFCLVQLKKYHTDMLVTAIIQQNADELPDDIVSDFSEARAVIKHFVETFKIIDPRLFKSD